MLLRKHVTTSHCQPCRMKLTDASFPLIQRMFNCPILRRIQSTIVNIHIGERWWFSVLGGLPSFFLPQNYFTEVEQAGFSPANVVPGIGHSPDKMLQFRIVSYADAHRYRLGVNYDSLPVNRPHVPVHTYHRDGSMRFDDNAGGAVNYEPNSFGGPHEDTRYKEPPLKLSGDADRYDHREGNDDYTQAGNLFRLMTPDAQARLIANLVDSMKSVPRVIQERQVRHFSQADPAYGEGVAKGLELLAPKAA